MDLVFVLVLVLVLAKAMENILISSMVEHNTPNIRIQVQVLDKRSHIAYHLCFRLKPHSSSIIIVEYLSREADLSKALPCLLT